MSIRMRDTDAGAYVVPIVEAFEEGCELERVNVAPEVEWGNIEPVRTLVGKGAFSNVYHVTLRSEIVNEDDNAYCDCNCYQCEFALKRLNSIMPANNKKFQNAACDIALEACLLQRLQHPNIIKLHAIKSGDLEEAINYRDFFLVLDFLTTTLSSQLRNWRKDENWVMSKLKKKASNIRLMNRLANTALGVAKGMEYLHSKNVIFRDLKPDNIGFDGNQVVRIFDFGLARDLTYLKKRRQSLGCTGTIRYMANEICQNAKKKKSYGLEVDVYSFGVLLWEVSTLRVAYDGIRRMREYYKRVVKEGERPSLKSVENSSLKKLISDCWHPDPSLRPTFADIGQRLNQIIMDYQEKNDRNSLSKSSSKSIQKGGIIGRRRDTNLPETHTQPLSVYFQSSKRSFIGGSKRLASQSRSASLY